MIARHRPVRGLLPLLLGLALLGPTAGEAPAGPPQGSATAGAGSARAPAAAGRPPVVDDDLAAQRLDLAGLDATLFAQRSAEARALGHQIYASALTSLHEALDDPAWTADLEQEARFAAARRANGSLPELIPAIILDVDETVLDNSAYQARLLLEGREYDPVSWNAWCAERAAPALAGALEFCRHAAEHGVTVFYVTNRRDVVREDTRANLAALGFPLDDTRETVLTRSTTSDKAPRRAQVAAEHRILLMFGDNLADFTSLFRDRSSQQRRTLVDVTLSGRWGQKWFVLPNPTYGDWQGALLGNARGLDPTQEYTLLMAGLQPGDGYTRPAAPSTPTVPEQLAAGPMPGWAGTTGSSVWLQTRAEATVQLRYWPEGDPVASRLTPASTTDAAGDHIALFELSGLRPGTTYAYELYLDGARAPLPWPLRLRTRPAGLGHGDPAEITFAIGSCAYVNDPPFDRPGEPYGGDFGIFDSIADTRPDFMLWLGDNTYLRDPDWLSPEGIRHRYAHTRGFDRMQRLLASTHHYATWDDHDYGPNDSDERYAFKREARDVFADYWPSGPLGTPSGEGVFQRFTWSDCEFFLTDDRTWRSPVDAPDGPDKVMLGPTQRAWLTAALRSSEATFKFVACGSQFLNPIAPYEGFADYPDERDALLADLRAAGLTNLYFLSGDRHHSELLRIEGGPNSEPWYDFTSSPLTAGAHDGHPTERDNPARVSVDGRSTFVNQRSFGLLRVTGPSGRRVLEMSCRDIDGRELWTHSFEEQR